MLIGKRRGGGRGCWRAYGSYAFYTFSAIFIPIIVVVALLQPGGSRYYRLVRVWVAAALAIFGVRVEATGAEALAAGQDYVLLVNHRSHFDSLAIVTALGARETRWVAKRELLKVPLFGYALRVTGQILVDRKDHGQAVQALRANLGKHGATVVFFAEGERSVSGALSSFKKGGAAFAIDAGLPVVPVAVAGSERVAAQALADRAAGLDSVAFGEPIPTAGLGPADRELSLRSRTTRSASFSRRIEPAAVEDLTDVARITHSNRSARRPGRVRLELPRHRARRGSAVAIDCGVMFPEDHMMGIDRVLPDLGYLREPRRPLAGLVLTHGHEDHLGALPYILPDYRRRFSPHRFTAALLERKLEEYPAARDGQIEIFDPSDRWTLGGLQIEALRVTHSIVDACAVAVRAGGDLVLHTGDFKLDPDPIDGQTTDLDRFRELGEDGVRLLLSDSTNVEVPGMTKPESAVPGFLRPIFAATQRAYLRHHLRVSHPSYTEHRRDLPRVRPSDRVCRPKHGGRTRPSPRAPAICASPATCCSAAGRRRSFRPRQSLLRRDGFPR